MSPTTSSRGTGTIMANEMPAGMSIASVPKRLWRAVPMRSATSCSSGYSSTPQGNEYGSTLVDHAVADATSSCPRSASSSTLTEFLE